MVLHRLSKKTEEFMEGKKTERHKGLLDNKAGRDRIVKDESDRTKIFKRQRGMYRRMGEMTDSQIGNA